MWCYVSVCERVCECVCGYVWDGQARARYGLHLNEERAG